MKRAIQFVLAGSSLLFLGGCYTSNVSKGESLSQIRNNPEPGLEGSALRYVDDDNQFYVTANDDWRKASDDWRRLWQVDRPSRLSPYPITR